MVVVTRDDVVDVRSVMDDVFEPKIGCPMKVGERSTTVVDLGVVASRGGIVVVGRLGGVVVDLGSLMKILSKARAETRKNPFEYNIIVNSSKIILVEIEIRTMR